MDYWIIAWLLQSFFYLTYSSISELNNSDPKFTGPINNVTVPVGRDAILTCTVDNLMSYKIAWLRVDTQTILSIQSNVITWNYRIIVAHTEHRIWQLRIRNVKESDRGWYMCQINTDPMKSQMGYLDVVVPPDIDDALTSKDVVAQQGDNVTLVCRATGLPTPHIVWRREKDMPLLQIDGNRVYSFVGSNLSLPQVNINNIGGYLCIASNGVPPTVSKRIVLMVNFAPIIHTKYDSIYVGYDQQVTLECQTEAYPNSVNFWLKDGKYLKGGTYESVTNEYIYKIMMRLTLMITLDQDFGEYRCVARNKINKTERTITLYHKAKLDEIEDRQQLSNSGNHYILIEELSSTASNLELSDILHLMLSISWLKFVKLYL